MRTFGETISSLRNNKGLSQAELAGRLQIAKSTLAMYETNKREPDFETLQKIADYFETNTDFLLGRSDVPSPRGKKTIEIDTGGINVAYFGGAKEELTEEEAERLKEELEMFRMLKAKRMRERVDRKKD